jgi:glycosyltransferase involved in cell wall biosynthesis
MLIENHPIFSKHKRIAFICFSSSLGGLELSILKLASEFNRRAAECIIVVPPDTPLADYAEKYKLRTIPLKPKWKYGDIKASIRLTRILKSHRIDIVIIMQSKDIGIVTTAYIFRPSVKLVFYQEMQSGINKRDFFHTWMYSKLLFWITLTKRMKQETIENTNVPEEKICVIPIGTDMHRFDPQLYNQADTRRQFDIPQKKIIVGVLGRLDPQKGQEEFVRAIPALLPYRDNVHFIIAGNESPGQDGYKKHLTDLSNTLGVDHCLQFLPFTDAIPEFISTLDIFVLPSYSETFGFVLVEAMAMRKAIIATNAGGVPEIITDGHTGLLIPPRDIHALANALLRLIKDEELRKSLSTEAQKDALKRFDMQHTIDRLVQLLDTL